MNIEKIRIMQDKAHKMKFDTITNMKTRNLEKVLPEIKENILYNIITQKNINPYAFVKSAINKYGKIDELIIVTYRVSADALFNFQHMLNEGNIAKMTLLINDNYQTLLKINANIPNNMAEEYEQFTFRVKNTHAKITLIKCGDDHYVISGSGNYSNNPKIEQYTAVKSKELYDFHKGWVEDE